MSDPLPRRSAGLLLYRRGPDGDIEVLLAHPGGPLWAKRDEGVWTVPKGEFHDGEAAWAVARREFEEETGHPAPDGDPIELGEIQQKGGKLVEAWALEGDLDPATAREQHLPARVAAALRQAGSRSPRSTASNGSRRTRPGSGSRTPRSRSSTGCSRPSKSERPTGARLHSMTPPLTRRPPWTVRVASFSAAHRWPVIALWFVATIGIFLLSLAAGGTDAENAVPEDSAPEYESGRAYDVFNASGTTDDPSQDLLIVISSGTGTVDDEANAAAWRTSCRARRRSPPRSAAPSCRPSTRSSIRCRPRRRPVSSRRTARRSGSWRACQASARSWRSDSCPVPAFLDELRAAHPEQRIHGLSGILANDDIETLVNDDLDNSLRITIPLTFAILLLAFGAAVAAFVP